MSTPPCRRLSASDGIEEARVSAAYGDVIRTLEDPLYVDGGLAVLRGNLAPGGAIIKPRAASEELLRHRGRAVVFSGVDDLERRVNDPGLDVEPNDVLVLRNAGPVGAPGMPEAGLLPIPEKLLKRGVRDMVRISDCRMSGTASGTIVLHVAPEAAVGGPLGLVRDGDEIELDVRERRLDLLVSEEELERRGRENAALDSGYASEGYASGGHAERGYVRLYREHVMQADAGCDFDFLRKRG